jgi:hypothetical protein
MGLLDDTSPEEHAALIAKIDVREEWRALGLVVDYCNLVEQLMSEIIAACVGPCPEGSAFLERYVLHNSVVTFGSKTILIGQIIEQTDGPKVDLERVRRVGNLRNAVAHASVMKGIRFNQNAFVGMPGPYLVVETKNSAMRFTERARNEVTLEFIHAADGATSDLQALLKHVNDFRVKPAT